MSEIVLVLDSPLPVTVTVDSATTTAIKQTNADSIDEWLKRVTRLEIEDLTQLAPILDAAEDVDVMRKLIRMCIILAHPERALANWLSKPADELMRWLYQVRTVAEYLTAAERGESPRAITMETWCLQVINEYAERDDESAERIRRWLTRMLPEQCLAELRTQQAAARDAISPKTEASGAAVPEAGSDQQTPSTERQRGSGGSSVATSAANGAVH